MGNKDKQKEAPVVERDVEMADADVVYSFVYWPRARHLQLP